MKRFAILAVLILVTAVAENSGPALRNAALTAPPSRFGATKPHQPFAVVMDVADQKGVTSVLATASGDASLYLSTGGAITNGIRNEYVRHAAGELVGIAAKHVSQLKKATNFDYPHTGNVSFFVRTPEGTFTETVPESELRGQKHPLSPVYDAGQKVISELRRLEISK